MGRRGRPKLFSCCPECGEDALIVKSTTVQGYVINRWCECSHCGVHIRMVKSGASSRWIRVRDLKINQPENTPDSCL